MPIYEYECQTCGHHLEQLQNISDPSLTHCPSCGKEALRRLISMPGFRLKGTGWYETDFKNPAKKKEQNAEAKTAKDSDKKAEKGKEKTKAKDDSGK